MNTNKNIIQYEVKKALTYLGAPDFVCILNKLDSTHLTESEIIEELKNWNEIKLSQIQSALENNNHFPQVS